MEKRIPLAVGLAAFAMACSDPSSPKSAVALNAPSLDVTTVTGYPFAIGDGDVVLCKSGDAAGVFTFNVSVNGGAASQVQITLTGAGTACAASPIFHSSKPHTAVDNFDVLTITEVGQPNWALLDIDIVKYMHPTIAYTTNENNDAENNVTATVKINHDMARRVTFENDFTAPNPPICDFITFGRLVWESGGQKVVISGNAGGFNADGSIKGEFHIEVNDTDHHVHDVATYGPIAAAPLASSTYTNSRRVTGTDIHGHSVELRLWDGGEPGKNTDRFWFNVNGTIVGNGTTGNLIDQGNMQYHANCRGPGLPE